MNWRLHLAQRCIRKADAALAELDFARFERLVTYARALLRECDAEDYAHARKTGRVITLPPSAVQEVR